MGDALRSWQQQQSKSRWVDTRVPASGGVQRKQQQQEAGDQAVDGGAGEAGNLLRLAISKAPKCTKILPLPK